MEFNVITLGTQSMLYVIEAQPTLIEEIRVAQATDPQLEQIWEEILVGKAPGFVIHERWYYKVPQPGVCSNCRGI